MKSRAGIYKAQNIRRYTAVKGSTQGEACLRSGVEIFAAAYPKVNKG